jgi:hypothetical protein
MFFQLTAVRFLVTSSVAPAVSPFDEAQDLQQKGKLTEAREVLLSAAPTIRASSNEADLTKALSLASQLSLSL